MAENPKKAAELGRSRKHPIKSNWDNMRYSVMLTAVIIKFTTHPALKELLMNTGNSEIIENSPYDYYWGCGQDGTGENKLGKILMFVRTQFQQKK